MKKDFARKRVAANQAIQDRQLRRTWVFVFALVAILLGSLLWFGYQYQSLSAQGTHKMTAYVAQMQQWMTERKTRLHDKVDSVKKIVTHKLDPNPPIHFEFYTALPHMQIKLSDASKTEGSARRINATMTADSVVNRKPVKQPVVSAGIFDANQLQRALHEELQRKEKTR